MNIVEHLPGLGMGVLTVGIFLLIRGIVRLHRNGDRDQARQDFLRLHRSRKLTLEEGKLHPRLQDLAVGLGGRGRRAGLQDVLRGADIYGRWFFVRRKLNGEKQLALIFEPKLLNVAGLQVYPVRPQARGLSRFLSKLQRRPPMPLHLRIKWQAPADQIDERSARMGSMLLQLMAQARQVVEPMGVHLYANEERVAIHTRRPLEGEALRVFLDVALALRKRILEVPQLSGALRLRPGESGGIQPIEGPVTRAVRAVGMPNDKSGPSVPYGPMGEQEPETTVVIKKKVRRRKKRSTEPKVEVIPSSRY